MSVRRETARDQLTSDFNILSSSSVVTEQRQVESSDIQSQRLASEETRTVSTEPQSIPSVLDDICASSRHAQFASSSELRQISRTQVESSCQSREITSSSRQPTETVSSETVSSETVSSQHMPSTFVSAEVQSRCSHVVKRSSSQPSEGQSLASSDYVQVTTTDLY